MQISAHQQRITTNPIIPVKTPKAESRFTLFNPRRLTVTILEPEQFFPTGELNCNFIFQVSEAPAEIYVELKSSNLSHALAQLANSLRLLQSSLQPKLCFVIIRRSPSMDVKTQQQLRDFSRRHKCIVKTKTIYGEHTV
ncbi:hypothetical protein GCM10027422_35690 [Hymenobacter arcticus]